jgi:hypothetical protein
MDASPERGGAACAALFRADGSVGRKPRPLDASHPSAWATLPRTSGAHSLGNWHNVAIGGSGMHAARTVLHCACSAHIRMGSSISIYADKPLLPLFGILELPRLPAVPRLVLHHPKRASARDALQETPYRQLQFVIRTSYFVIFYGLPDARSESRYCRMIFMSSHTLRFSLGFLSR